MSGTHIAKVVVEIRTKSLNRPFDYLVPAQLSAKCKPGHRVLVSFGRQVCQGYVVGLEPLPKEDGTKLKPILSVLDDEPILTQELLDLCDWLVDRTVCTLLEAIQTILPAAFRTVSSQRYQRTSRSLSDPLQIAQEGEALSSVSVSPDMARLLFALEGKSLSADQLVARFGPEVMLLLPQAIELDFVQEIVVERDKVSNRTETFVETNQSPEQLVTESAQREKRAPKQAMILRNLVKSLAASPRVSTTSLKVRPSDPALQALVRQELIWLTEEQVFRDEQWLREVAAGAEAPLPPPELTGWQSRALDVIDEALLSNDGRSVVLHGVTGSGKTEVYMRAIERCLGAQQSAIVLVPEISLTPQMVERFTGRFGTRVAVMHSGLSQGERKDAWERVRRGAARVVIGARSAVFAPVREVGLVIVDEEHEPSYKQEETPFYDAREVAEWRARYHHGTVVFGSATPSLEAMAKVESGKAVMAMLPERIHGGPMPTVEIVDMREELKSGNRSLFSEALASQLEACVEAGHQAILFLNRRGYSAFLMCRNCGDRIDCPNCDISLTLHRGKSGDWLRCHYCQYTTEVVSVCPTCSEQAIRPFGIGTQQVEEHLHQRWPNWRVLRMDVDTTRKKGAHHELIRRFEQGEANVLLGTQMVAKGLDFPNVAFVGVISADTMLAVPDYRANERTFDLLTQVAGRAGRGATDGATVIQTYRPDHYAVIAAARHDYGTFYRREKETREAFLYPPYRELTLFLATHKEEKLAAGAAQRFEREVRRRLSHQDVVVLPAVQSGILRVENRFRYQVVVKYSQWDVVKSALHAAYTVVSEKMIRLGGNCVLDVKAGRM